ncbi:MAG: VOC family protein [Chloroflexi bacterium]|nr:VOC family protein [Chloroflexota bacterium]
MFKRIHHLGVAVRDMDQALKLYSGVFGLPVAHTMVFERWGARDVTLSLGNDYFQLIESIDPKGAVSRFLERRGEGVYEVALEVDDIQGVERQLKVGGLAVRPGVQDNVRFVGPKDTHGVVFELLEKEPMPVVPANGVFTRIHHIGMAVKDIDNALKVYTGAFGFPLSHTITFEKWGAHDFLLKLGDQYWELIESLGPERPVGRFLANRGEGVYVVSLQVENILDAEQRAKAGGLAITPGVQPNIRFLHPTQTHGVLIEMHEGR